MELPSSADSQVINDEYVSLFFYEATVFTSVQAKT